MPKITIGPVRFKAGLMSKLLSMQLPHNVTNRFAWLALPLVLIFVQLGFASLHVEGKLVMGPDYQVSPMALAMLRIGGAALVFIPLHWLFKSPKVSNVKDIGLLTILAILGIVNNQVLYLLGLQLTSPISATLLVAMIPVFTLLITVVLGRSQLVGRQLIGIALGFAGIGVLTHFSLPQKGDVLVLLNAISFALYLVFSKDILQRLGMLTVMAWVFGISTVLFLPFGIGPVIEQAPNWSPMAIGLICYIVIVPSIMVYGANAWALKRATPNKVAIFMFLQPLAVVLLSYFQLDLIPTFGVLYAAILIMTGVATVVTQKKSQ